MVKLYVSDIVKALPRYALCYIGVYKMELVYISQCWETPRNILFGYHANVACLSNEKWYHSQLGNAMRLKALQGNEDSLNNKSRDNYDTL
jgi:hypothetical protein